MKKLILSFVIAMSTSISAQNWPSVKPPIAEKQEFVRVIHGDEVKDPYYWMIDYFTKGKDSTKVVNYLKDENTYWETMMKDTEPLRNELFQEMKARIKEKDETKQRWERPWTSRLHIWTTPQRRLLIRKCLRACTRS